jgi:hypothetical protein
MGVLTETLFKAARKVPPHPKAALQRDLADTQLTVLFEEAEEMKPA